MEKPVLRALTIPELLDRVLQIYRRHILLLMTISAVIMIPAAIIHSVSLYYWDEVPFLENAFNIFLYPFAQLATVIAISGLYLGGETTVQASLAAGAKRYGANLGATIIKGAIFLILAFIFVGFSLGGPAPAILGAIILLPAILFLSTRWSLAQSIVVLEKVGAWGSLKRSWALTDGYFWRVFGTSFVAGLLSILLSTLPYIFVNYLLGEIGSVPYKITLIVPAIIQQFTSIIASPLVFGVNVLIYYDLMIRKEGFDLLFISQESAELLSDS